MVNYQSILNGIFGLTALQAAKEHARLEFPKESCGFIDDTGYVACDNKHENPLAYFTIDDPRYNRALIAKTLQAVVHSHPNGPMYPSELDMRQQLATSVPWLIVNLNEDTIIDFTAWGDTLPMMPIIGRPFLHGVFDCYSCLRDTFRFGRDALKEQGVGWPYPPIVLPEVPRGDDWWKTDQDLYLDHFGKFGFRKIPFSEAQAGDVWLAAVGTNQTNPRRRVNHGGVLTEQDFILHHLPRSLSRRTPAGVWARSAEIWLRYEGSPQ
jgi:proteasome lid subunit RPN8/RPN11